MTARPTAVEQARATLDADLARLQQNGSALRERLRQVSPWWLLGGAFAGGALAGRLLGRPRRRGVRMTRVLALLPWLEGALRLWRGSTGTAPSDPRAARAAGPDPAE